MILESLYKYYERLRDDPNANVPLMGFGDQKIHFGLVINAAGNLLKVRDLRTPRKTKLVPASFTAPQLGKKRSSGHEPNFLWDNGTYVLGAYIKGSEDRARKNFEAFKKLHRDVASTIQDEGLAAVLNFLDSWDPLDASTLEYWEDIKAGSNLAFQLEGHTGFVHDRPAVRQAWTAYCASRASKVTGVCLVTGTRGPIARLHPPIKGIPKTQAGGTPLVSFNADSFKKYGKEDNFSAPVREDVAFAYTTALNHLLRPESRQKAQIGVTTVVFWTERASLAESLLGSVLKPYDGSGPENVGLFLSGVMNGKMPVEIADENLRLFVLALTPAKSRISVQFWYDSTVLDVYRKIGQHFKDLAIARSERDPEFPALGQLMRATAVREEAEKISSVLSTSVMQAMLSGTTYPTTLLLTVLDGIRAGYKISYLRAAMIKACLVRQYRIYRHGEEVTVSLDQRSTNVGYRLGRLFAACEKVQREAIPGISHTIRDTYWAAASTSPRRAFPYILERTQHHIRKAEYGVWADKMIAEIVQDITEFPVRLSYDEQGMFVLGYYHQRQAFYTKRDKDENEDENPTEDGVSYAGFSGHQC
jgi:CRISPR-associated protein Csd1